MYFELNILLLRMYLYALVYYWLNYWNEHVQKITRFENVYIFF